MRSSFIALGLSLGLVANLVAQTEAETQRATLTGLRSFAVYARVQLSQSATLQRIDERVLRNKIEDALRREGIRVQTRSDMREGSQASLDLLYMVIQTKDTSGHALGFAASSCLQASQMVTIPRLTTPKHIAYAVVSTWRSCGLLVGDSASLGPTILQNADEHIIRFIDAWRFANTPPPDPRFPAASELSMAGRQYRRWHDNGTLAAVHTVLRKQVHQHAGKQRTPSAAGSSRPAAEPRTRRSALSGHGCYSRWMAAPCPTITAIPNLLILGIIMTALGVSGLRSSDPTLTFRVLGAPDPGEWQSPLRIQVQPGKLTVLGTELQRIGGQLEAKLHTAPPLLALEVCDRSSLFASTDSARASRWDRVRYEAIIQPLPSGRYRFDVSPCPLDYGVLVSETQEVVIP